MKREEEEGESRGGTARKGLSSRGVTAARLVRRATRVGTSEEGAWPGFGPSMAGWAA